MPTMKRRRPPEIDMLPVRKRNLMTRTMTSSPSPSHTAPIDKHNDASETDALADAETTPISIPFSNEKLLKWFYTTRFIQMQQIACKTISKAWIKVVQPKKQALYPYNGGKRAAVAGNPGNGDLTKPDWWPRFGCRHKEPDHIEKSERLILLLHILRNLHNYKASDGNTITVERLQQSTRECSEDLTVDEKALKYLNEIYMVRAQEERYLRGDLDKNQRVIVAMPKKKPRESTKKVNAKTASAARVKRNRIAAHEPRILVEEPSARQQQSPKQLRSSLNQSGTSHPKRKLLPEDRAPVMTEGNPLCSPGSPGRSSSGTARASFSSTEVQCSPHQVFGYQEPLPPPARPEHTYTVDHSAAVQPFIEPTENLGRWDPIAVTTAQAQVGTNESHLYIPSLLPDHKIHPSAFNQLARSTTAIPYLPESRNFPAQPDFRAYGSGTFSALHHNLPGYDSMSVDTRSYYLPYV
ncbi:hypothetical protein MMC17_000875 [Xylographa soralifera]|nr:hypothetical protein [Xylographa soralifera]